MKKTIKMINVMENKEVEIIVNDNVISIEDKEGERLFFKITENTNQAISILATDMINKHFEKGFVIMSTNIFDYK